MSEIAQNRLPKLILWCGTDSLRNTRLCLSSNYDHAFFELWPVWVQTQPYCSAPESSVVTANAAQPVACRWQRNKWDFKQQGTIVWSIYIWWAQVVYCNELVGTYRHPHCHAACEPERNSILSVLFSNHTSRSPANISMKQFWGMVVVGGLLNWAVWNLQVKSFATVGRAILSCIWDSPSDGIPLRWMNSGHFWNQLHAGCYASVELE